MSSIAVYFKRKAVVCYLNAVRCEETLNIHYLTETIYRHGAKYTPAELIRMPTGDGLDAKCCLAYLQAKFGGIYGLENNPNHPDYFTSSSFTSLNIMSG